jgi:hypothetical protein
MGGMPAIERLLTTFYKRVPNDPCWRPSSLKMSPQHWHRESVGRCDVGDLSTEYRFDTTTKIVARRDLAYAHSLP